MSLSLGVNPQITLSVSDDGGKTWSADRSAPLGGLGQYRTTIRWRRLGRSQNRCFRIVCSEPVFVALIQADIEASSGQ